MCRVQLGSSFSPSVQSFSYMIHIACEVPFVDVFIEDVPIVIEVVRRSEYGSVVAESY